MPLAPITYGDDGRRADAPIIGEQLRSAPRGLLEKNRDAAKLLSYGSETVTTPEAAELAQERGALVFGGRIDPFKATKDANLPTRLPRRGVRLDTRAREPVVAMPESYTAGIIRELQKRPGREAVTEPLGLAFTLKRVIERASAIGVNYDRRWMHDTVRAEHPDGVTEDQIDALCERLARKAADLGEPHQGQLRAVGCAQ